MSTKGPYYSPRELLARLISFDTTSHKTNLPLVRFVEDYLVQHGVLCKIVMNAEGDKANLFATLGPDIDGGVALSGHTDVVPVEGQNWDTDPFKLTIRDSRLFGRGTSDMKAFLACVLAAVPKFLERKLAKPIHIAFSHDEEIGCVGVRSLIAELGLSLPKPGIVIVGEPTSMKVVDAHKGPVRWQIDIKGRSAHSSLPALGVNAVAIGGQILQELEAIGCEMELSGMDDRFDPPHSSLQVTTISGGHASNIIPADCKIGFGIRALPGFDVNAIEKRLLDFFATKCLPEMRSVAEESAISLTQTNAVPPFAARENSDAVSLALQLTGGNETFAVSYATEAGLFQDSGSPAVVCGPGDIAQAHTANEWIDAAQIESCSLFLDRLRDWAQA